MGAAQAGPYFGRLQELHAGDRLDGGDLPRPEMGSTGGVPWIELM